MRQIKFRGKDFLGRWHYGHLHQATGGANLMIQVDSFESFGVLPDTVGQFTGLLDKNGKDICEGDIITFDNHLQGVSQVVYDYAGFDVVSNNYRTTLRPMMNNHIRVIGNIHDNPELLKGGKE